MIKPFAFLFVIITKGITLSINSLNKRYIMKKIIVLALAVLLGAGTMSAQRGGGRQRMSVEDRVAQMTKELDLTADQQKKITAIYTELESKRKEKTERPTREQMRAEFEKIDKQVTAVLTKSQQKKYEEIKQARQNRRQK